MTTLALHRDAQGERWDAWLTLGWCLGRRQLDIGSERLVGVSLTPD